MHRARMLCSLSIADRQKKSVSVALIEEEEKRARG